MRRQLLQNVWKQVLPSLKNKHHARAITLQSCEFRRNASYKAARPISMISRSFSGQLNLQKTHVEVTNQSWPENVTLSYMWLRDHCRCNECFNHKTNQRNVDLLEIPQDIQPTSCEIKDQKLTIKWDDGHVSEYLLDWLQKNTYTRFVSSQTHNYKLWSKQSKEIQEVAQVDMGRYMTTDQGVYDIVKSIVDYGAAIVTNVPATVEATRKVVEHIALVQHTMFGSMWDISSEYTHYDTAYTNQALGAHNDTTYFTEGSGLQVFHCVHHDGEGGETLLVDGFRVAYDLQKSHPQSFDRLSTLPIESEYLEPDSHYFCVEPVLKLHPITKQLQQIRFNLYDRAPMRTLPNDKIIQFYEDLRLLAAKVRDPDGEWWIKLRPGMVLFINNWRVLHGRASYTGLRQMTGCYVTRADFLSRAKVLGII